MYLYAMKQWQVLQTVFPKEITENFEFTNCEETPDSINYWLEEREYMSREDYKKGTVRPYGPTALLTTRPSRTSQFVGEAYTCMFADANG